MKNFILVFEELGIERTLFNLNVDNIFEAITNTKFSQTTFLQIISQESFTPNELSILFSIFPCSIKKLVLTYLQLNIKSMNTLSTFFNRLQLEYLDLSNNPLGDASTWIIIDYIKQNSELKTLKLSNCQLTSDGIWPLLIVLSVKNFTCFDISHNSLHISGATYIENYLSNNAKIKILLLNSTELSEGDIETIIKAAGNTSGLETLDLRENQFIRWRQLPPSIKADMAPPMK